MSFKKLDINSKQMHRHTDWHIDKQMDWKKKENQKNTNTINAGPPDPEYLYYPLDMGGVTLKALCCQLLQDKKK